MSIGAVLLIIAITEIATLYRVEWVYRARQLTLDVWGHHYYNRLPSFTMMVITFWVWNVDAFLTKGDQQ
ncbi:hypothetical protein NFK84_14650 [Enterobacter ludwigii]|uniref:hypothetical protein n=1 Tax=Enterobacter cloacae complex TaxID=354276 RepID=UPI000F87FFF3|nr:MULTISPECIES: hypothetical protein [Enterobacter cloacae complex]MCU6243867.1 hypothetical protein [Enterobacter asburiae]RTP91506.1 hypothetical protein EKN34_03135 [Enterobacter asburiae]WGA02965.1 hypothetical protein NFK84_14650 [Enterobacter ludwigii]